MGAMHTTSWKKPCRLRLDRCARKNAPGQFGARSYPFFVLSCLCGKPDATGLRMPQAWAAARQWSMYRRGMYQ